MSEEQGQVTVSAENARKLDLAVPPGRERSDQPPRHAEEVGRFQKLLKNDPEYAYRRCGLALLYSLPGEAVMQELAKFGWKARDAQDLFNLGALRSQDGDHKEALKYYEKAVELDPDHYDSLFNLALTYQQLEDARKARSTMQKCIKILEEKHEIYSWEKNDLQQARQFLDQL